MMVVTVVMTTAVMTVMMMVVMMVMMMTVAGSVRALCLGLLPIGLRGSRQLGDQRLLLR